MELPEVMSRLSMAWTTLEVLMFVFIFFVTVDGCISLWVVVSAPSNEI